MNLKKIEKVFTSKFVGPGPSSYKKRIYRAAVSQRLRNTVLHQPEAESAVANCSTINNMMSCVIPGFRRVIDVLDWYRGYGAITPCAHRP
jgi:hypothetical protein